MSFNYQKYRDNIDICLSNPNQDFRLNECLVEKMKGLKNDAKADSFKLYRYMSINTNTLASILEQKIYLSNIGDMNDYFEGFENINSRDLTIDDCSMLKERCKIKSFSEDNMSELMWAHYGDENRGICVEYDLSLLAQNNNNDDIWNHLFPVHYTKKRDSYNNVNNMVEDIKNIKIAMLKNEDDFDTCGGLVEIYESCLCKTQSWKYENEWRLLYSLYDLLLLKNYEGRIDFPCVSAIYMGCRISKSNEQIVKLVVQKMNELGINIILRRAIAKNDNTINYVDV